MEILRESKQFCPVINFREMLVVHIDIASRDEYGPKGAPVLINNGYFKNSGNRYLIRAELRAYNDNDYFQFVQYATGISSSFTYHDMEEVLRYANAPVIEPGKKFLLVVTDSAKRRVFNPVVLKAGENIAPHCFTPLDVEKLTWRIFDQP